MQLRPDCHLPILLEAFLKFLSPFCVPRDLITLDGVELINHPLERDIALLKGIFLYIWAWLRIFLGGKEAKTLPE